MPPRVERDPANELDEPVSLIRLTSAAKESFLKYSQRQSHSFLNGPDRYRGVLGFKEVDVVMRAGTRRVFGESLTTSDFSFQLARDCIDELQDGCPTDLTNLARFVENFFTCPEEMQSVRWLNHSNFAEDLCKLMVAGFKKDEGWAGFAGSNEDNSPF